MTTATQPTTRSLTCAETATLVRQALKNAFPTVKFGVRSKTYSGGASIRVSWVDGPTSEMVQKVTCKFEGASFDGMIDLKSYNPDSIVNGERVHFGADYIFCERQHSVEFVTEVAAQVAKDFGLPMPEVKVNCGDAYVDRDYSQKIGDETMGEYIWRKMVQVNALEPVTAQVEIKVISDAEIQAFIECKEQEVAAGVTSEAEAAQEIEAAQTLLSAEDEPEFPEPVYLPAVKQAMDDLDEARTIYDALLGTDNSKAFAIAARNFEKAVTALQIALKASMN